MSGLTIHNVRFGFATNSSSSHSILLLPSLAEAIKNEGPSWDDYGWQNFTLAAEQGKRHYLISQIANSMGYNFWSDNADEEAENQRILAELSRMMGEPIPSDKIEDPVNVDHQSTWVFPGTWDDPTRMDEEFIAALDGFMRNQRVVVLGGNDNSDGHPLIAEPYGSGRTNPMRKNIWQYPFEEGYGQDALVARNDETHWVLFNRDNGTKVRLSFETVEPSERALTPELVDVKITDYCPFGCGFCYQDSTPKGKHASLNQIDAVINELRQAKVFEVALGGGEPTFHPDFLEILKRFRAAGIIPNFTTRSLAWMKRPDAQEIMDSSGAFAYSAHTPEDIEDLARVIDESELKPESDSYWGRSRVVVHIVMGTLKRSVFEKMVASATDKGYEVTLLGWKTTGRAASKPDHPYLGWWLDAAKKHAKRRTIGIDTALAAEAKAAGQMEEFPHWMYHTCDGDFSCYADAVAGTCAPSSWQPERGSWPLAQITSAFQEEWVA